MLSYLTISGNVWFSAFPYKVLADTIRSVDDFRRFTTYKNMRTGAKRHLSKFGFKICLHYRNCLQHYGVGRRNLFSRRTANPLPILATVIMPSEIIKRDISFLQCYIAVYECHESAGVHFADIENYSIVKKIAAVIGSERLYGSTRMVLCNQQDVAILYHSIAMCSQRPVTEGMLVNLDRAISI